MRSIVNLGLLKEFAKRELRDYHFTRDLILAEPQAIPMQEFVAKSRFWLCLLRKEEDAKSR
jgi:hypothetical protein